ncbi:MAG: hypothetical protein AB8F95_00010 [Bacteroidia bacterium]
MPSEEDDSHTNLYFDALGNRITGRWIETDHGRLIFILNLANLHIEIQNDFQQAVASFPMIGKTMNTIEQSISSQLSALGLTESGFSDKLHFEIPVYSFESAPVSSLDPDSMEEWKYFRKLANDACSLVLGHVQKHEEIRIWPHHFDTGIYTMVKENLGLGFGLAMKDDNATAPYFYMAGYPKEGKIVFENVPQGDTWSWKIGEHWQGAVLSLDQFVNKPALEQQAILNNYIKQTLTWYVAQ